MCHRPVVSEFERKQVTAQRRVVPLAVPGFSSDLRQSEWLVCRSEDSEFFTDFTDRSFLRRLTWIDDTSGQTVVIAPEHRFRVGSAMEDRKSTRLNSSH